MSDYTNLNLIVRKCICCGEIPELIIDDNGYKLKCNHGHEAFVNPLCLPYETSYYAYIHSCIMQWNHWMGHADCTQHIIKLRCPVCRKHPAVEYEIGCGIRYYRLACECKHTELYQDINACISEWNVMIDDFEMTKKRIAYANRSLHGIEEFKNEDLHDEFVDFLRSEC